MDSLNISETGLFLLLFKELLISPERSFAQISFSSCLVQVSHETKSAHANGLSQLGLCLIYSKEFLFKYFMELSSYICCIIMTSIYLIMFIIILEHIKTSQVKNATLCSIKAYLALICCQTNKQSCQKTRGGTEYTVLVNIKNK